MSEDNVNPKKPEILNFNDVGVDGILTIEGVLLSEDDVGMSGWVIGAYNDYGQYRDDFGIPITTTTNNDGEFELTLVYMVPGDVFYVKASKDDEHSPPSDTYTVQELYIPITPNKPEILNFNDVGADGILTIQGYIGDSEGPLEGWTVSIYDEEDNVVTTTITDSEGLFQFHLTNITPGYEFYVIASHTNDNDSPPSDTYTVQELYVPITPNKPEILNFNDVGVDGILTIEGYVGDNEGPLGGWSVSIYNDQDEVVDTVNSDSEGLFQFHLTNITPGYEFYVIASHTNDNDSPPSDTYTVQELYVPITPNKPTISNVTSVGTTKVSTIQGYIGDNEGPLEGWTVSIYNDQDEVVTTTTTDSEGLFQFDLTNVSPGDEFYVVASHTNDNDSPPSDIILLEAYTPVVAKKPAVEVTRISDEGEITVSGIVEDNDNPLEGWTVNIYDEEDSVVTTTTTDSDGRYSVVLTGVVHGDMFYLRAIFSADDYSPLSDIFYAIDPPEKPATDNSSLSLASADIAISNIATIVGDALVDEKNMGARFYLRKLIDRTYSPNAYKGKANRQFRIKDENGDYIESLEDIISLLDNDKIRVHVHHRESGAIGVVPVRCEILNATVELIDTIQADKPFISIFGSGEMSINIGMTYLNDYWVVSKIQLFNKRG